MNFPGDDILRNIQDVLLKDGKMIPQVDLFSLEKFRPVGRPIRLFLYSRKGQEFYGPNPNKFDNDDRKVIENERCYNIHRLVAFMVIVLEDASPVLKWIETNDSNIRGIIETSKKMKGYCGFNDGGNFRVYPDNTTKPICQFLGHRKFTHEEMGLILEISKYYLNLFPREVFELNEDFDRDLFGASTYLKCHYYLTENILNVDDVLAEMGLIERSRFDLMDFENVKI